MHLTVSYYHLTYEFQSESTLYNCLNVKKLLAFNRHDICLSGSNGIQTHNQLVHKQTLNVQLNWPNDWAVLWVLFCTVHLTACYYHATYVFQSESTLYSCLNVTPCFKQVRCLFKWQKTFNLSSTQQETFTRHLTNSTAQSFGQFG